MAGAFLHTPHPTAHLPLLPLPLLFSLFPFNLSLVLSLLVNCQIFST